jgi:hypothetical protein
MRNVTKIAATVLALALTAAGASHATETQWWLNDAPGDYAKAEVRGAVLRADATTELGPAVTSFPDDSLKVAWAIALLADGSVALAGDHGRIDRWTAQGGVRPWVRLGGGQVLSLARDGDGLLAGTGPSGLVYRIGARGDTTLLARTGERYVWALAATRSGVWAATGTRGRLMRIEGGKARIVFDSGESNLLCLVADGADGADGVWAGGDSQGRVYHTSAAGATRTLFDAGEDEVRALARTSDGALWAAALSGSGTSNDDGSDDDDKPLPARTAPSGTRSVLYRIVPDSATVAWWTASQPLVYALAPTRDGLVAATGNRAGLYRVERIGAASQLLAPVQGQVTALVTGADGTLWAATANPVALIRLGPGRASEGEIVSSPLDCRRFAHFGHVRTHARGRVEVLTRSGNCDPADSTWSDWEAVTASDDGGRVRSPGARYLQWKAKLSSADARLEGLEIAWREQNLAPRVDEITIAPQGLNFRDGELVPRSESVTQTLSGGQKVEYSVSLPSTKAIRELPVWARGLRTLSWRAVDPNGDPLRFRVELRNEDGGAWVEIGKDLEASLFSWNTATIPDGRYRLRVTASDVAGNAVGEERSGDAASEVFTVDNTPPSVTALAATGARIEGSAEDSTSPLWRLEVAVDDGDWRTLAPEGGLADERRLRFAATLPALTAGEHVVSVRAVDLAGNSATRAVHVKVAAAH